MLLEGVTNAGIAPSFIKFDISILYFSPPFYTTPESKAFVAPLDVVSIIVVVYTFVVVAESRVVVPVPDSPIIVPVIMSGDAASLSRAENLFASL